MEADTAAPTGGAANDIVQIPGPAAAVVTPRDAARSLASFRMKQREGGEAPASAEPAPPQHESADAAAPADAAAAAVPETPGEPPEPAAAGEPAATEAPIEPPRSWSEQARERFGSLPRETQAYLVQREQERDREVSRLQNETSAERKALAAEWARAEATRLQYEEALPAMLANLDQQRLSEFADIKSVIDVERLAREDWPRYMQWDALQKRIASGEEERKAAAERKELERQTRLDQQIRREQELFLEKAPEAANPAQRMRLEQSAIGMLQELGFSAQEMNELYRGQRTLSLHDHRLQLILRDGVRFRDAQKAAKEASAKPVPPVQRPGVAQSRGAAQEAAMQNLARRLDQTGSVKDAARLLAERRKAAR